MKVNKFFIGPLFLIILLFIACEKDTVLLEFPTLQMQNNSTEVEFDDDKFILSSSEENDICLTSSITCTNDLNLLTVGTHQRMMYVSYDDPVKDHTGNIDVEKFYLVFEPYTGKYDIIIKATPLKSFYDYFRVNVKLHNPGKAYFTDIINDYEFLGRSNVMNLTGINEGLKTWNEGDLIAANSAAGMGNPPGVSYFNTSVSNFPLHFSNNKDLIAYGIGQGITEVKMMTEEVMCEILIMETESLLHVFSKYPFTGKMSQCLTDAVNFLHIGRLQQACNKFSEFEYEAEVLLENGVITKEQHDILIEYSTKVKGDCDGAKWG